MLLVVGLDRSRSNVSCREALGISPEEMPGTLQGLTALGGVDEVAVLSTSCRLEIYAASRSPPVAAASIAQSLAARAGVRALPLFELHGEDAMRHLWRVASGLGSAILGEPCILGQVREAFAGAAAAGTAGPELTALALRTALVARHVRAETAVGRADVSFGHAAAALAEKVLGPLRGRRAVVLGEGRMARLAAVHLREQGVALAILGGTTEGAEALAREVGGTAGPLGALPEELRLADVVVSAASAELPALSAAALVPLMKARRRTRLVLVDLAVPRTIPSEAGRLEGVYLCDADDLERLQVAAQAERPAAVAAAERIVEDEIAGAREETERRAAPAAVQAMRVRAPEIAREEAARAARRLGRDPEVARWLEALAGAIVSRLHPAPAAGSRQGGASRAADEALMTATRDAFDLPAEVRGRFDSTLQGQVRGSH